MKKLWNEFKAFAFKGNVLDLAIGMIIGSAFTAVVNAVVGAILQPILGIFTDNVKLEDMMWGKFPYGQLLQALIVFFITALVLFAIVKAINKAMSATKKPKEEAPKEAPRLCPYCFQEIHKDATRCPHCTSELTEKK